MPARRRLLFVVENITLAQVMRLRVLAAGLDAERYEVHFASSEFDPMLFEGTNFKCWPVHTIEREAGLRALAKGDRLYEARTLERYVADELRLFDVVKPDAVIGDFRLSLAVSAPLAKIPCASLINAYWSPYAVRESFPVPDHPIVRLVGVARAEAISRRPCPGCSRTLPRPSTSSGNAMACPSSSPCYTPSASATWCCIPIRSSCVRRRAHRRATCTWAACSGRRPCPRRLPRSPTSDRWCT